MPTLISAITKSSEKGIYRLQAIMDKINVSIGAIIKTTLLEPDGSIVSLESNFKASAHGCNKPNRPTTFGPFLSCINPIILLSASVRYATKSKRGIRTIESFKKQTLNIKIRLLFEVIKLKSIKVIPLQFLLLSFSLQRDIVSEALLIERVLIKNLL